ncbi:hypothetical protein [Ruminococcus bicirculans (ex Wegman et al. 2014)]|jgi:hypothetical protein|uniref:Uncharacterized protein n=2 Tax=root TaxID=1 RepID=A0AAW6DY61_9FIRM|nr:hypothetical protein [Ruminococcus bicirculans (ex Wegman et al. 2014)]MDB8736267.1 hypothetical protein [Ruminococcus bicirculans (ex Wegman et al. 2014)]MDB8742413.1 hypothetical protein [Ruminococcus bicirculans (ex Wegman et al. 2014)]DAD72988.1 MAG TPA: hypothetical protein [Siphoviridae sp. ctMAv2]
MTMEMLNELIDASVRGTLLGISAFFWIFGIVAIWKWFFGVTKRFVLWLFPNLGKKKSESEE